MHRLIARYGYMEDIDVSELLARAGAPSMDTTYCLGPQDADRDEAPQRDDDWREKISPR